MGLRRLPQQLLESASIRERDLSNLETICLLANDGTGFSQMDVFLRTLPTIPSEAGHGADEEPDSRNWRQSKATLVGRDH